MSNINNNFDIIWKQILTKLNSKKYTFNKRTKTKVKEDFGYSFVWDLRYLPISNIKKTNSYVAAAELVWSLSGEKSIQWISKHCKIWNKFTDDKGEVSTAYGFRWRHQFGVDQIKNIINKLKKDPTSRQQVLMNWNPMVDNIVPAKNIPCPVCVFVAIVGGKLNLHLSVRSNDIILGMGYDLYMYSLL